jgi:predicted RNA binding protein YcfA (HicA-like mRNA interferase family)
VGSWSPCKRTVFVRKLKRLGFSAPEPGGRHFFVRHGRYTLTLPGNPDYSIPQLRMLLREVERGTGIRVTADDWAEL